MGRVFIDGFDHQKIFITDGGFFDSSTASVSIVTGFGGGSALQVGGAGGYIYKGLPSADAYYVGFHLKGNASGQYYKSFRFLNGLTILATLNYSTSTGDVDIQRGDNAAWLGSGYAAPAGTWFHVQLYYLPSTTAGVFTVKINGVQVATFSGNTSPSNVQVNGFSLSTTAGGTQFDCFDNIVIDDAAWPGVSRVALLSPTGAGNSTQWDPSAGSNWDCVNEVPYSDADDISTNVADEVDTYAASDLPAEAAAIRSVQVVARVRREGAGLPNIALAVRTTGGDAYSADQLVQTSYFQHSKIWEQNPGTAAAWTPSEVNAMEIGVKARA